MQAFAWIMIKSKQYIGKGNTVTFYLPGEIIELIEEGKELGEADDIVFNQNNFQTEERCSRILTENVINRTDLYSQGVILALIPLKHCNLYYAKAKYVLNGFPKVFLSAQLSFFRLCSVFSAAVFHYQIL